MKRRILPFLICIILCNMVFSMLMYGIWIRSKIESKNLVKIKVEKGYIDDTVLREYVLNSNRVQSNMAFMFCTTQICLGTLNIIFLWYILSWKNNEDTLYNGES